MSDNGNKSIVAAARDGAARPAERGDVARIATSALLMERPSSWRCWAVADAAGYWGLCEKTIRRNPKRFGGVRIGGRWRFSRDGIEGAACRRKA